MCGISGIIYHNPDCLVSLDDLKKMCRTMVHRGPDDEGFFIERNVGLGVRRLSIIDLVRGRQPITNEDGSICVVFNGEIYNYLELRQELEQKGHRFSTNTDTETIVHAYEEYGEECVKKFNGMFAFAIWDQREEKLMLARDRLGVKPLYYCLDGRGLIFGSEVKALLAHRQVSRTIDLEALDIFLTFEYIPAPLSIFRDIKKLLPGHILIFQDGKTSIQQYWELHVTRLEGSVADLSQHLYDLLKDSVRLRLASDVPLGAFLSGGIDSSTIVCLMSELMERPVKTFSIGFDDSSYNELPYARLVARHFGTDHHELTIQPNVADLVQDLVQHLDEPLADVSIFPTYLVSKLARQNVTVALSGDGGDELFGGYDWYLADKLAGYYHYLPVTARQRWIPWMAKHLPLSSRKKGFTNMLKRFVEGSVLSVALHHFRWNIFLTEEQKARLYSEAFKSSLDHGDASGRFLAYLQTFKEADPLWQAQFADIKTYLADDILVKLDRMSMATSLEARMPYLDYRVVEFAAALPSHLKVNGLQTKYLLRHCMASRLPRTILTRPKEGFSIPMKNWLRRELRPLMEEVLSPERIAQEGLFNPSYIEQLKVRHLKGMANHSHQLWALMIFEIWRDLYL